jgi:hypothetical protein
VTTPEIRLGRWQDVLPGTYDPARAIVVTDPPYGLAATGGTGNGAPGVHSRGKAYRRRAANRPGVVPYLWQGWAVYGRLKVDRHARQPQGDAISARSLLQAHDGDLQMRRTSHRALTPYASALWIVDNWVDPGCVVLDPFAGHGTIGRAARQHGFDYIGAEVDPEYAATAAESFSVERLTMDLTG